MKHSIKKNLIIAAAVFSMMIISVSSVFAATPAPAAPTVRPVPGSSNSVTSSGQTSNDTSVSGAGNYKATKNGTTSGTSGQNANSDNDGDDSSGDDDTQSTGVTRTVPTPVQANPAATMTVVAEKERAEVSDRRYVSKGALAIWILLSILINTLISFWVGNRFYRLSKKDTHITSEIRALRRDIDEKFVSSVGGFSEQETDIANNNEDYSYNEGGITQKQPSKRTEEDDEEFRKWESRLNQRPSSQRNSEYSDAARRRKYQPEREEFEEEDYLEDEEDEKSVTNSVKSKAKELLGDIFPFNED